mgnify:FL=1
MRVRWDKVLRVADFTKMASDECMGVATPPLRGGFQVKLTKPAEVGRLLQKERQRANATRRAGERLVAAQRRKQQVDARLERIRQLRRTTNDKLDSLSVQLDRADQLDQLDQLDQAGGRAVDRKNAREVLTEGWNRTIQTIRDKATEEQLVANARLKAATEQSKRLNPSQNPPSLNPERAPEHVLAPAEAARVVRDWLDDLDDWYLTYASRRSEIDAVVDLVRDESAAYEASIDHVGVPSVGGLAESLLSLIHI